VNCVVRDRFERKHDQSRICEIDLRSETQKGRREIRTVVYEYGWAVVKRKPIEISERGGE
jgi:hypothetical protein